VAEDDDENRNDEEAMAATAVDKSYTMTKDDR
jgi:hypothetical protein